MPKSAQELVKAGNEFEGRLQRAGEELARLSSNADLHVGAQAEFESPGSSEAHLRDMTRSVMGLRSEIQQARLVQSEMESNIRNRSFIDKLCHMKSPTGVTPASQSLDAAIQRADGIEKSCYARLMQVNQRYKDWKAAQPRQSGTAAEPSKAGGGTQDGKATQPRQFEKAAEPSDTGGDIKDAKVAQPKQFEKAVGPSNAGGDIVAQVDPHYANEAETGAIHKKREPKDKGSMEHKLWTVLKDAPTELVAALDDDERSDAELLVDESGKVASKGGSAFNSYSIDARDGKIYTFKDGDEVTRTISPEMKARFEQSLEKLDVLEEDFFNDCETKVGAEVTALLRERRSLEAQLAKLEVDLRATEALLDDDTQDDATVAVDGTGGAPKNTPYGEDDGSASGGQFAASGLKNTPYGETAGSSSDDTDTLERSSGEDSTMSEDRARISNEVAVVEERLAALRANLAEKDSPELAGIEADLKRIERARDSLTVPLGRGKVSAIVHHSSAQAGSPVIGAGGLKVKDGAIVEVTIASGHYKPKFIHLQQTIEALLQNGALLDKTLYYVDENGENVLLSKNPKLESLYRSTMESVARLPDLRSRLDQYVAEVNSAPEEVRADLDELIVTLEALIEQIEAGRALLKRFGVGPSNKIRKDVGVTYVDTSTAKTGRDVHMMIQSAKPRPIEDHIKSGGDYAAPNLASADLNKRDPGNPSPKDATGDDTAKKAPLREKREAVLNDIKKRRAVD